MNTKNKLLWCLIANFFLLIFLIIMIFTFKTHADYFRFGVPKSNENPLIVISVKIDTYIKYNILLIVIGIINISKIIIDNIGIPILDWNIYNPDKKIIVDFNKKELLIYSNLFYLFSGLRSIFTVLIAITQIDIAIYSVFISQIASFFAINWLLNEKEYKKYDTLDEDKSVSKFIIVSDNTL